MNTDLDHPLQCTIHCGFNMCKNCIESFITSSKDDYQEASDGNYHVKVFLHCPNCRSNLSYTIRDTLLLRKADEVVSYQRRKKKENNDDDNIVDGHLDRMTTSTHDDNDNGDDDDIVYGVDGTMGRTSSQFRLERAMHTPEVQHAIDHARRLEAEYLGKDLVDDWFETDLDSEASMSFTDQEGREPANKDDDTSFTSFIVDDDYDEWGVEADIDVGVHSSFRMPPPPKQVIRAEAIRIDPTLFAGLDYFLTDEQRLQVTELMTGGDPSHLAKAAIILRSVALHLQPQPRPEPHPQGQQQDHLRLQNDANTTTDSTCRSQEKPPLIPKRSSILSSEHNKSSSSMNHRKKSLDRRSSVFQLIEESKAAHLRAATIMGGGGGGTTMEEKKVSETHQVTAMLFQQQHQHNNGGGGRSRVAQHRQLEKELHIQAEFQKRFPIPVRMPKAIVIDLITLPLDMEFVDYTWNGTKTATW
jgi:hypothetical protein